MDSFALIHSERDVVFRLELSDDFEGSQKICLNPLGGISQIKKQLLPLSGLHRLVLGQQFFPYGRHVRQHRPVDHSNKSGRGPQLLHKLVA